MKLRRNLFITTALAFSLNLAGNSDAATFTWDGASSPASANWSDIGNWGGTAPADSFNDVFIFAGTTNVGTTLLPLNNDRTGGTATSITFNSGAGAFVIGGNAITLGGNVTNNEGTNVQTLNMNLDRGIADRTFTTAAGGKLVLGGALSSGTASDTAFYVQGAGTLALAGSWSDTDVGLRARSGGTLDLKDGATITGRSLNIGAGVSTINVGSGTYNFSAANSSFGAENTSSATSYNQTGGTITFAQLTVANGQGTSTTMNISAGTLNATTLRTSRGPTTTAANDATTDAVVINISGTGLVDATSFSFGDGATGYYGKNTVTITGSTAELRATTGFNWGNQNGNVRNNTVEVDGGLFSTMNTSVNNNAAIATLNIGNGGTLQARSASTTFLNGLDTFNIKNGGAKIDTQANNITITQPLTNFTGATTSSLTKSGDGTLTLSGANGYVGDTNVNAGTLVLSGVANANNSNIVMANSGNLTFAASDTKTFTKALTGTATNITFNVSGNTTDSGGGNTTNFTFSNTGAFTGNIVINTGLVAPLNDAAFGNAANLIKLNAASGASAGLVATADRALNRSIELVNAGGNSIFRAYGTRTLTLDGVISGSGNFVKTDGGTVRLNNSNNYTGNTNVGAGTLSLGNGTANTSLANGADVVVAAGATLNLNYLVENTDTVDELWISGVQKSPGVYGASDPSGQITGTGTLTVSNGPSTSDYNSWGAPYSLSEGSENLDLDGDGVTNFEEYAFGLIPNSGASVNPITQQLVKSTGQLKYTRRATPATTSVSYTYESSTTLSDPWVGFTPVSATSNNATPIEEITLTVPPALLENSKLFIRVKAAKP